jgi:endonuclease/exonuclease/phosphatase (EEP) superfamily protein YafD
MRLETIGIVSYNLWRENEAKLVARDLTYLMGQRSVDIICLQEGANWYRLVSQLTSQTNGTWRMAATSNGSRTSKQNIVLWRSRQFTSISVRLVDLAEDHKGLSDRSVTRVRMAFNGSDRQLVILATHMHSHVQNPSWWRLPRQGNYRAQVRSIAKLARRVDPERGVIAVADWNVDLMSRIVRKTPFFPPAILLKYAGMRSNWEALGNKGIRGTRGNRYIDGMFSRANGWLRFKDHQVVDLSSDHRALLVRFTLTVATPT